MSRVRRGARNAALARVGAIAALASAVVVAGACGRGRESSADSAKAAAASTAASTSSTATAPAAGAPRAPACPRTGHWIPCQVRDRIDRAGLTPHDTTLASELPSLGQTPTSYRIGKAVLVIYLFPDSSARTRAGRQLDTTKYVADTHPLTILSEATVIQNDNLLALLFSKNEHQRERVSDALTAGPPQP
jgi:hypothetical protein